jgi:hypothetical protein
MKKILILSTLLFSNLALSCPDLTGIYSCPPWNNDVSFDLKITQKKDSLGVTVYEFNKKYLGKHGESLSVTHLVAGYPRTSKTLPPPVPNYIVKDSDDYGRCKNKTLVVEDTVNKIDDRGALVSEVDGAIVQLCERKIWPPKQ